jgi:NADH-quinone oxidoreductase subunit N
MELQALSFFCLTAFYRKSVYSTEAGLKYLILAALGSGFFLHGCAILYGFTGTTNLDELAMILSVADVSLGVSNASTIGFKAPIAMGVCFICVGFFFKLAAAPFHKWLPDIYQGAPTSVTAFFAIVPKFAIMAVFLNIVYTVFLDVSSLLLMISLVSVTSMLFGSFGAIGQRNIKRLLAFSSIGHMGYLLMGVATGSVNGVASVLAYMLLYIVMNIGVFAIILGLKTKEGKSVEELHELSGLCSTSPVIGWTLSMFMFAMAGIPPLGSFFTKFFLFNAAIDAGMYPLVFAGLMASLVSSYYYLRAIKIMIFDAPTSGFNFECFDALKFGLVLVSALCVLTFGAYFNSLFGFCVSIAKDMILV